MSDTFGSGLIGKIASGEEEALSGLYHRYAQLLYNYATRVLMSGDQAGEAVCGVFQSVWIGIPAWPDPAPPTGVVLASRMRETLLGSMRGAGRRPSRDVDLWSIVSSRSEDPPVVASACASLRKCGVVSSAVLTMVYFGGRTIADTAERLSMTESECRSRLQVSLEGLAGGGEGGRRPAPHGGKFLVNAAAWALGAVAPIEEPAYAHHLADGCLECSAEIERYFTAAHLLPSLLPEVRLPDDLHEKLLFSVRLAGVAAAATARRERQAEAARALDAERSAGPGRGSAGEQGAGERAVAPSSRAWKRFAFAGAGAAFGFILLLGAYVRTLSGRLEEQSVIVESLQDRHTDLLLKYDHLAGISGFFESKGVVTVLDGTPEYPGLTGKIVWDTTGKSAMLQILDPPEEIRHRSIRVSALEGGLSVKIAEFRGDGGDSDSGGVLYRFFTLDPGREIRVGGFAVDLSPAETDPEGEYSGILRSAGAGPR